MAGRKPKPSSVRLLEGNPGHRPINMSEPKPSGVPACPTHLDAAAKKEWRRVAPELIRMGLLTTVDRAALTAYCSSWSRWLSAEGQVTKYGAVIKQAGSTAPLKNPYVTIANAALDQMRHLLCEFGMTPSSRTRLQANPLTPASDTLEEFMSDVSSLDMPDSVN